MSVTQKKLFANQRNRRSDAVGSLAENTIAQLLTLKGWQVLAQNFRHIGCELDIIALKGGVLIVVEVKYRQGNIDLNDLLSKQKKKSLLKGSCVFLTKNSALRVTTIRFDLVIVRSLAPLKLSYFQNVLENQ